MIVALFGGVALMLYGIRQAGEALGLAPPPRGDADVARALEAAGGVPLGLTVARE